MSVEENKSVVRHCIDEAFNKGNTDAIDEFFSPNVAYHSLPPGVPRDREGYKHFLSILLTAFPDYHINVEDMVAEGDKVVTRATTSGTHNGEFMGVAPTGKQIIWTEIFIWRIEGKRVVEEWAELDLVGMMQQLGAVSIPEHR